jgi:hypothetical protein
VVVVVASWVDAVEVGIEVLSTAGGSTAMPPLHAAIADKPMRMVKARRGITKMLSAGTRIRV